MTATMMFMLCLYYLLITLCHTARGVSYMHTTDVMPDLDLHITRTLGCAIG